MKRLVASRRLKRTCDICDRSFSKGDVYYVKRNVFVEDDGSIFAYDNTNCPRCKHKHEDRKVRIEARKGNCDHPIVHTVWRYIPSEAVMEPSHDECLLCREVVWK